MLVEQKLTLADPIAKWIPDFPQGDRITVDHLLRFRAGIPHRVTDAALESQPQTAESMTRLVADHIRENGLLCEPGAESYYSSATYCVLARVMELVDGAPFDQILERRLFKPLGMDHTRSIRNNSQLIANRATSYVPGAGNMLNAPLKDLSFLVGAGSVQSTAEDLYKYVQALHDPAKLHPAIRQSMGANVHLTGATNGYYAYAQVIPEREITVVFLGNTWCGCADALRQQLVAMIEGGNVQKPQFPDLPEDFAIPQEKLIDFVGKYESRPGAVTEVSVLDGNLCVASSVAIPWGPDQFYHQVFICPVVFERDDSGTVTGMRIESAPDAPLQRRLPAAN
jgi:hypothetical protein